MLPTRASPHTSTGARRPRTCPRSARRRSSAASVIGCSRPAAAQRYHSAIRSTWAPNPALAGVAVEEERVARGQSTAWIATSTSSAEFHRRVRSWVVSVGNHPWEWIDGLASGTVPTTACITKNGAPITAGSASAQRTRGTGTHDDARPSSTRNSRMTSGRGRCGGRSAGDGGRSGHDGRGRARSTRRRRGPCRSTARQPGATRP